MTQIWPFVTIVLAKVTAQVRTAREAAGVKTHDGRPVQAPDVPMVALQVPLADIARRAG